MAVYAVGVILSLIGGVLVSTSSMAEGGCSSMTEPEHLRSDDLDGFSSTVGQSSAVSALLAIDLLLHPCRKSLISMAP
jgi:hypothetical protein